MMKTSLVFSALAYGVLWAAWRWNRRPPEPPGGGVEQWWATPRGAGGVEHDEWLTTYTLGDS
jgi:hypothetical protein